VVEPRIEEFAIDQLIEMIGADYTPIAAAKGLKFQISRCSSTVRSDRTLLGRMLRNLVENALRYTDTGGVAIACHGADGTLRLEVHDTGIGIPAEHLTWIWEEFHQVSNPERDRNRGLGLGLAIVQRLSVLLGHPVDVRSTPGQGSVFSILLPLGRSEPQPTSVAAIEKPNETRLVVLVDDDAIVLLGLKAMLKEWGYDVLAASSTDQALDALKKDGRHPDMVIVDYRLREQRKGTEAVLRVREACGENIPGIILTGETGTEAEKDAADHGLALIHKPVTPRQLSAVLNSQGRVSKDVF
jgi:CheY-like chemotaxis protein/anti-sigma regulatory factor (Ser/Thr protein kinase)